MMVDAEPIMEQIRGLCMINGIPRKNTTKKQVYHAMSEIIAYMREQGCEFYPKTDFDRDFNTESALKSFWTGAINGAKEKGIAKHPLTASGMNLCPACGSDLKYDNIEEFSEINQDRCYYCGQKID